ncbi:MAG: MotA/TolQ/ExbB proton channel family protein [Treponema sp.]|nr:MotA/TolQ/ExbB proton channel family protein [Treponema sp.]
MENASFTLLALFKMGGIFMWPLLFFSIATLSIAVEKALYLLRHNLRMEDLAGKLRSYIQADDFSGAEAYLSELVKRRIGARILLTLVKRRNLPEHQLERAVESEASGCVNFLESGFNFLTALGSLSPLTGFLGTVSGMIGAFKSIAEATEVNAQLVANGIYEALITTVFGLIIAIVAMIAHSLFAHAVDGFAAEAERTCSDLIIEISSSQRDA